MRASKARSEHSVGIACHRRWAAYGTPFLSGMSSNTQGGSRMRESRTYRLCAGCALKAHRIQSPEMETAVKPSSQPRTKSCVMFGDGHCEA
jgi:hypothetical protein